MWSTFNRLPLVHKPNNWGTATLDLSKTKPISQGGEMLNGDNGNHQNLPVRTVGYRKRFQGYLLPYTSIETGQEAHEISHPEQVISCQDTAIRCP